MPLQMLRMAMYLAVPALLAASHRDSVRQDAHRSESMSIYKKVKNDGKQTPAGNPLEAIEQARAS